MEPASGTALRFEDEGPVQPTCIDRTARRRSRATARSAGRCAIASEVICMAVCDDKRSAPRGQRREFPFSWVIWLLLRACETVLRPLPAGRRPVMTPHITAEGRFYPFEQKLLVWSAPHRPDRSRDVHVMAVVPPAGYVVQRG